MKISALIVMLLPLLVFGQGKMTITGKIKGLPEGQVIVLSDLNKPGDTLAYGPVTNGVFKLNATLKEPMLVSLALGDNRNLIGFMGNTSIKITGDTANWKNSKVTGSATHKDFRDFQKKFDPLFERLMKLNQGYMTGDRSESLTASMDKLKDTIQTAIDAFIRKRKNSPVSAFVIAATFQLKDDILLTEKRFNSLKKDAVDNMYGTFLKETINEQKITAIGSLAQEFVQEDTAGKPVSLSSFRGKYVLIDFWASWCGPCRQENPNVVATFQKFNNRNFTVLGISLDRPGQKDKWLKAIHDDNLTWTHLSDLKFWNNAVAQQYRIQSIPQNFLVGPDGKIVAKNLRGPALDAKLCEILGCN